MFYVTRRFTFESSHNLPKHLGNCHNIHGHSYKLEVCVKRGKLKEYGDEEDGMVLDFQELDTIVKNLVISKLDHKHLNDILENPTAENISLWIFSTLYPEFALSEVMLHSVKLWETENSFVEYTGEDLC